MFVAYRDVTKRVLSTPHVWQQIETFRDTIRWKFSVPTLTSRISRPKQHLQRILFETEFHVLDTSEELILEVWQLFSSLHRSLYRTTREIWTKRSGIRTPECEQNSFLAFPNLGMMKLPEGVSICPRNIPSTSLMRLLLRFPGFPKGPSQTRSSISIFFFFTNYALKTVTGKLKKRKKNDHRKLMMRKFAVQKIHLYLSQ